MRKSEMLSLLAEEYKRTVRLPDDISLRDYKDTIAKATGLKISDKRATRALNELTGFTSLLVVDRGTVIRVWRETPKRRKRVKNIATH